MNIRSYIYQNFKNNSPEEIREAIEASISSKDELVLPGLGVLFEIIWNNYNEPGKNILVDMLTKDLA